MSDKKSKPRVLIAFDGENWFARSVSLSLHDGSSDEMVYRCDNPIGVSCGDPRDALAFALNFIADSNGDSTVFEHRHAEREKRLREIERPDRNTPIRTAREDIEWLLRELRMADFALDAERHDRDVEGAEHAKTKALLRETLSGSAPIMLTDFLTFLRAKAQEAVRVGAIPVVDGWSLLDCLEALTKGQGHRADQARRSESRW